MKDKEVMKEIIIEEAVVPVEDKKKEAAKDSAKKEKKEKKEVKASAKKETKAKTEKVKKEEKTAEKTKKKSAAKKAEVTAHVTLQFDGKAYTEKELTMIAKEVWKFDHQREEAELEKIELYVKPEEGVCYYVFNSEITGSFRV